MTTQSNVDAARGALLTAKAAVETAILLLSDPAPPPPVVPPVVPPPPPPPGGELPPLPAQPATLKTPHDEVPNFGRSPTIWPVRNGAWSDPAVWNLGRTPRSGDVVCVGPEAVVVYDVVSDERLACVAVLAGGTLRFRRDADTRLRVTHLLVNAGGALDVGTGADPVHRDVRCEVVFNDVPLDEAADPGQYGNGLLVLGDWTSCGCGGGMTAWGRTAGDVPAGSTEVRFADPVVNWRTGDLLLFADDRAVDWNEANYGFVTHTETATVAAVSADGLAVTLAAPLGWRHNGPRDMKGGLSWTMAVGNLTRSVAYRSENPAGVRGHVMATGTASVDVRHSLFQDLGRTTNAPLGADNVKGRYAGPHLHHLHHLHPMPGTPPRLEGNAVVGGLTGPIRAKWGLTVHDSVGVVTGNVVYNVGGAGVVLETGSEAGTVVSDNLVVAVAGPVSTPDSRGVNDVGFEGAAYWFPTPTVRVTGNVAYDTPVGYMWFFNFYSAVPMPDGTVADNTSLPLLAVSDNEAGCGLMAAGLHVWRLGVGPDRWNVPASMPESVVRRMRVWHVQGRGYYNYETNRLTFDGLVARGDPAKLRSGAVGGVMFHAGDYIQQRFKLVNCDVQGFQTGFFPSSIGEDQRVEDSYFCCYANAYVAPPWWLGDPALLDMPRAVTLKNVRHDPPGMPELADRFGPQGHVVMFGVATNGNTNLTAPTAVLVEADGGDPAANYRVYFREAARTAILSQSYEAGGGRVNGCPEAGLTNEKAFERYGVCFGGGLPPASAATRPGVVGLVEPVGAAQEES